MAPSQQGIPKVPSSVPITKTNKHLQHIAYHSPWVNVVTEETNNVQPATPVTPDQRLHGPNRIQGHYHTEKSSDRNLTLRQSEVLNTVRPTELRCQQTLAPASPPRTANVRVRRSQHSLTLLESPARAGHAARMKQIFEDASRGYPTTQDHAGALYPQLPNISRKASPTRHGAFYASPDRPAASSCVPVTAFPVVPQPAQPVPNLSVLSERTSASWSDDSGYFITDSRGHASALTAPPNDRIFDWLLKVSRVGTNTTEDTMANSSDDEHGSQHSAQSIDAQTLPIAEPSMVDTHGPSQHTEQHFDVGEQLGRHQEGGCDPFVSDDSRSSTSPLFGLRGAQQEHYHLPPYGDPLPKRIHTMHQHSDFAQSEKHPLNTIADRPALITLSSTPPFHSKHNTPSTPVKHHQTPETNDGIQLSPLSPNVCIDRGPSRYHPNRKQAHIEQPYMNEALTQQLKENVPSFLGEEKLAPFGSPFASRNARAGTRFQRGQYNTLTFNINKQA